ncbi:MAG: general stress protein [Waterburya sp.]
MLEKRKRGFAAMDEEMQRQIASKGGKAAHEKGTAHEFTSEEARKAGHKGGATVSQNRQHMAEIGRKGGKKSHKNGRDAENDHPNA